MCGAIVVKNKYRQNMRLQITITKSVTRTLLWIWINQPLYGTAYFYVEKSHLKGATVKAK